MYLLFALIFIIRPEKNFSGGYCFELRLILFYFYLIYLFIYYFPFFMYRIDLHTIEVSD